MIYPSVIRLKEQKKAVMGKGYKALFAPQPIGKRYKNSHCEHIGQYGQG
jgi:hypothetical protein